MHIIKVELYSFTELSLEAQAIAIEARRQQEYACGYSWDSEVGDSLKCAIGHLDFGLGFGSNEDRAIALLGLIDAIPSPEQESQWTGYCADYDLFDAIKKARAEICICDNAEISHIDVVERVKNAAQKHRELDFEYQTSDEVLREALEGEQEEIFTIDGELFKS